MSDEAGRLLDEAVRAAARGDPSTMLENLMRSGFLDGLVRRLQREWGGRLPPTEVEESVALSVDAAYATVSAGGRVLNLGAWLWKTAQNKTRDRWRDEYALRRGSVDACDSVEAPHAETDAERQDREALAHHRRSQAIRLAREMIPRIGEGQVVDVMELVIDAAEQGLPDLPASSIAETLGISSDAARTLVSRGLNRLRREAQRQGVALPQDIPATEAIYGEEE